MTDSNENMTFVNDVVWKVLFKPKVVVLKTITIF
jgi:hypothetical protein